MRLAVVAVLLCLGAPTLIGQDEARVVRQVAFEGNKALDDEQLSAAIATTNSAWLARTPLLRWLGLGEKRRFDERAFQEDVIRLQLFYRLRGFAEARIDTVVRRTPNHAYVTFYIEEGEPIVVESIEVDGIEAIPDPRRLRRRLPIAVGEPFDRYAMGWAADTIRAALRNRGYPWAQVFTGYDEDREAHRARISYLAEAGLRARVGRVEVIGPEEVDTAVVLRAMALRAGDYFSQRALYESQRGLYNMDVFRFVDVTLIDTLPPEGPPDSVVTVDIRASVNEGALRRMRLGSGYGTLDCFRVQGSWTARNFLGGARTLDISSRLSKLGVGSPTDFGLERSICSGLRDDFGLLDFTAERANYNMTVSLRQPWLFSTRNNARVSVFAERRSEVSAFVREAVGGNVALTRNLGSQLSLTFSYELSEGHTEASDAQFCAQFNVCRAQDIAVLRERTRTGLLAARLIYDNTSSLLDASEGSRRSLSVTHASGATLSERLSHFSKAVGELAFYYPIGRRGVFAWRVQGGLLVSPELALEQGLARFVPLEQRFYAGGANSVRGYAQNELGPLVYVATELDVDTNATTGAVDTTVVSARPSPTGGNALVVANAELRFPFIIYPERLRLALFVDVGQVWERGSATLERRGLRATPGMGFRLATPVGPVRLDVAWNPYERERGPLFVPEEGSLVPRGDFLQPRGDGLFDRLTFHFSVGQAF